MILTGLGLLAGAGRALDTIQLKEGSAVWGHILVEKPEWVVVDVGYTVLVIPRQHVERIQRGAAVEAAPSGETPVPNSPPVTPVSSGSSAPEVVPSSRPPAPAQAPGGSPAAERSVRELVTRVGEAVVQVRTPSGLGSGFFINAEGDLITNFHVIEGETQISVEVYHQRSGQLERRTYKQVRIVAMNKFRDLALLRVEDPGAPPFVFVPVGDSDALAVGERVFAVGSPLGLERTVTEGIISTKTRVMQGDLYLQTTAQINPGNSGGPLFNLRGEVVGVTNMKINFGEGLGFAIPARAVQDFLTNRDAFAYDNNNPSSGYRYLEPPGRLNRATASPES